MKKVIKEVIELASGFNFEFLGNTCGDHLKFRHRPTGAIVFHSSTPSDHMSTMALRAQFRRIDEGRVPTQPRRRNGGRR